MGWSSKGKHCRLCVEVYDMMFKSFLSSFFLSCFSPFLGATNKKYKYLDRSTYKMNKAI